LGKVSSAAASVNPMPKPPISILADATVLQWAHANAPKASSEL